MAEATIRVKVVGDNLQFVADMEKTRKSIDGVRGSVDSLSKSLLGVKGAALIYLAQQAMQATERMYGFARSIATSAMDIERQSKVLGMSAEAYQKLSYAAKMSDVDVGEFAIGMKMLSKTMEEAVQGTGDGSKWFLAMGISAKDASGNMKPLDQMMGEVADKFASWEDGPKKIAIALALFGRSGEAMIPILNQGKAGIKAYGDELARMGGVVDNEILKKGAEAEDIFKRLETRMQALKLSLAPAALEFAKFLEEVLPSSQTLLAIFQEINRTIKDFKNLAEGLGIIQLPEKKGRGATGEWEGPPTKKTQPPSLPNKEDFRSLDQYYDLMLKYLETEKEIAEFNSEWEKRRDIFSQEQSILKMILNNKLKQIDADEKLSKPRKEQLKIAETEVFNSQKSLNLLKEKETVFEDLLKANKNYFAELERDVAKERQMAEIEPVSARPFTPILKTEEIRQINQAIAEMQVQYAEMTGDIKLQEDAYQKILQYSLEKIAQDLKDGKILEDQAKALSDQTTAISLQQKLLKERNLQQGTAEISKEIAEMTGNWTGMKDVEIALVEIEGKRLRDLGIEAQTVEKITKLRKEQIEAERTMNVPKLIDIGGQKACIDYNKKLVDQFENILPNSLSTFRSAFQNAFDSGSFKNFFSDLEKGFSRLIMDISFTIAEMEILKAMGYEKGGTGGGNLITSLFGSLFGGGGLKTLPSATPIPVTGAEYTGVPGAPLIGMQSGGDFWVSKPTGILVGEGGQREHIAVTPASKMKTDRIMQFTNHNHFTIVTPDGNVSRLTQNQIANKAAIALQRSLKNM